MPLSEEEKRYGYEEEEDEQSMEQLKDFILNQDSNSKKKSRQVL